MRNATIAMLGAGALAACHAKVDVGDDTAKDKTVHIETDKGAGGDQVSVDIPGFDAKVALPNLDLARHVDLDGIRLAPDTKVGGVDINARDKGGGHGQVLLSFTSPQPPAALVDYYRKSATDAGYEAVTAAGDALTATKRGKQFALAVSPAGAGSKGTITMSGGE